MQRKSKTQPTPTTSQLVHTIAARYDDSEQAEALVELLKRTRNGVDGEDESFRAQAEAFTFTELFRVCAGV